jgi:hypothetical protein
MPWNILTRRIVERESCVANIVEQWYVCLIPEARVIKHERNRPQTVHSQTTVLVDGLRYAKHFLPISAGASVQLVSLPIDSPS